MFILNFVAFVVVGDVGAVLIASTIEPFNKSASLLVFLALFVAVFCATWLLAVRVTERFFGATTLRANFRRNQG